MWLGVPWERRAVLSSQGRPRALGQQPGECRRCCTTCRQSRGGKQHNYKQPRLGCSWELLSGASGSRSPPLGWWQH